MAPHARQALQKSTMCGRYLMVDMGQSTFKVGASSDITTHVPMHTYYRSARLLPLLQVDPPRKGKNGRTRCWLVWKKNSITLPWPLVEVSACPCSPTRRRRREMLSTHLCAQKQDSKFWVNHSWLPVSRRQFEYDHKKTAAFRGSVHVRLLAPHPSRQRRLCCGRALADRYCTVDVSA
jgi:hypothetical protein